MFVTTPSKVPDSMCWGPLREKFVGFYSWKRFSSSFNRIASAEDSPFQKTQTFWKIIHHKVNEIYFCELSCEQ